MPLQAGTRENPAKAPMMLPSPQAVLKTLRIVAGVFLAGLLLYAASLATRDCTVGVFVFDNCLWVWLREELGLPASKLLRAGVLELVGLALAAGLYLTLRYVFPRWKTKLPMRGPQP